MQRIEFQAMNCHMLAVVDGDIAEAGAVLAAVPAWFEQWEQCFSRFRPDSELSRLNRNAGSWVNVSTDLFSVIGAALWAAEFSDGLVSPTLLGAMEQAGYYCSFEHIDVSSIPQSLAKTRDTGDFNDWRAIQTDASTQRVFAPANVRLDLSGTAKGWAAEQAVGRLSKYGAALVDAGGDIATCGPRGGGEAWPIGLADPLHPGQQLDVLMLNTAGVATSGRDYRRWQFIGAPQHHIMDPRTGQPAQTDVLTATIVAPTMRFAETAAKTALILGSQAGLNWVERHPELAATLVLEDGHVLRSQRMDQYTWK